MKTSRPGDCVPVREYLGTAAKDRAYLVAVSSLIMLLLPYQRQINRQLKGWGMS